MTIGELAHYEIKSMIKSTLMVVCNNLKLHISHIRVGFQCSTDDKLYWTEGDDGDRDNGGLTLYDLNGNPKKLTETQKPWFSGQLCS